MCLDCYPIAQKTSHRGNVIIYIMLAIAFVSIISLIIYNNVTDEPDTDNTEVYDPDQKSWLINLSLFEFL